MEAALLGMAPVAAALVFMGGEVNDQATGARNGRTPLALAAREGHLSTVKVLLRAGADPNWGGWRSVPLPEEKGGNPLPESLRALCSAVGARNGTVELVETLLAHGAKIENPANGFTALGCLGPLGADRARVLLAHGANPNGVYPRTAKPLITVFATAGWIPLVQTLLDGGADINARGNDGRSALMQATSHARAEMVEFLLARGADRSLRDRDGKTALDLVQDRLALADDPRLGVLREVLASIADSLNSRVVAERR